MSDASPSAPAVPDLSQLQADLERSFQPSWVADADNPEKLARLANRFARDEPGRPARGRRDPRHAPPGRHDPRHKPATGRPHRKSRDRKHDPRERPQSESRDDHRLAGWKIHFVPDPRGIEGIAKHIKTTARAYALFDLARLVLERPERHLLEFEKSGPAAPPLWQCAADLSLWMSKREAESHALATRLEDFYTVEKIPCEPPKGNFACIAQCGMSGTLLGPPNHHEYQSKLRELHASRFARMSFDAFKARVRMLHDEESLARWREQSSSRTQYTPRADPAAPAPEGPVFKDFSEVEAHFRAHCSPSAIIEVTTDRFRIPGAAVATHGAGPVKHLVREAHEHLWRFPLPMAHGIGGDLHRLGLQIFKSPQNILHASVARPRPLDPADPALAAGIRQILEAIAANPKAPRPEQWKAVLSSRTPPGEETPEAVRNAVAADFAWLLREGHLIDYANGAIAPATKDHPHHRKPKSKKSPQKNPRKHPTKPQQPVKTPGLDTGQKIPDAGFVTTPTL
jgi:hypothetical protein